MFISETLYIKDKVGMKKLVVIRLLSSSTEETDVIEIQLILKNSCIIRTSFDSYIIFWNCIFVSFPLYFWILGIRKQDSNWAVRYVWENVLKACFFLLIYVWINTLIRVHVSINHYVYGKEKLWIFILQSTTADINGKLFTRLWTYVSIS